MEKEHASKLVLHTDLRDAIQEWYRAMNECDQAYDRVEYGEGDMRELEVIHDELCNRVECLEKWIDGRIHLWLEMIQND